MNIKAWAILTTGLADGYELTKSPARVQAAKESGQTVMTMAALAPILKAIQEAGMILIETESGYVIKPYFEMMGS